VRTAAMAKVKGWPALAKYADEGIRGTRDASRRPGLHALLAPRAEQTPTRYGKGEFPVRKRTRRYGPNTLADGTL
jgi:hypothetical protein